MTILTDLYLRRNATVRRHSMLMQEDQSHDPFVGKKERVSEAVVLWLRVWWVVVITGI